MSALIARKEQRRYDQPAKLEISISQADHLFREVRIENSFIDVDGGPVALTNGARLDVTFEAETMKTG